MSPTCLCDEALELVDLIRSLRLFIVVRSSIHTDELIWEDIFFQFTPHEECIHQWFVGLMGVPRLLCHRAQPLRETGCRSFDCPYPTPVQGWCQAMKSRQLGKQRRAEFQIRSLRSKCQQGCVSLASLRKHFLAFFQLLVLCYNPQCSLLVAIKLQLLSPSPQDSLCISLSSLTIFQ